VIRSFSFYLHSTIRSLITASGTPVTVALTSVFVFALVLCDIRFTLVFTSPVQILLLLIPVSSHLFLVTTLALLLILVGSQLLLTAALSLLLLILPHLTALISTLTLTLPVRSLLPLLLHVLSWNTAVVMTLSIWHKIDF
jgi:hypothetical protein